MFYDSQQIVVLSDEMKMNIMDQKLKIWYKLNMVNWCMTKRKVAVGTPLFETEHVQELSQLVGGECTLRFLLPQARALINT